MKYSTRFNPTTSGNLTVGNLYAALVNATEAHRSGGRFIVRVDDTQEYWLKQLGKDGVTRLGYDYYEELSKFMKIDLFERQSQMPNIRDIVNIDDLLPWVRRPMFQHDQLPEWIISPEMEMFPYAPMLTLEKVVWDYAEGSNWLIRGEDLVSEFALYCYFVDVIRVPRVRHTYIPRLRTEGGNELASISKSLRVYSLCDQIKEFGVETTLEFLKRSCLTNPEGEFVIENIKCRPTIVGFKVH